ncbi:FAD-binding protein [Sphaerisporangium album]|uniref:FAD-binding protein n=1 Tax=Sphaerisporangium album TaxID=509200 RepID=A0A367FPS0_9ACTN|nr:FAD-dependent oxidoreductase [Sphaerisporangium album]RCG31615.1 FAD-binding protein [Sphaerisporangium album]
MSEPVQETPDLYGAYPRLGDWAISLLSGHGVRRPTEVGEVLYQEGEPCPAFYVILAGKVAVVERYDDEENLRGIHGPGRFLGELGLLTGQAGFLRGVVREAGEVLVVPVEELRALVADNPSLGDVILRAFLIRRTILIELGAGFRIIGSRHSADSRRLREFAARNRLPHKWIELEEDKEAEQLLDHLGFTPKDIPVAILRGERVLRNPSNAELARAIGLPVPLAREIVGDLVIVGAGPAGLAAAVYGASEGLSTVVLDSVATGGQAATSSRIENYLGFPSGISGGELAERAVIQAEKFGAHFSVPAEAVSLSRHDRYYVVGLDEGRVVNAHAVVIATGARYRKLDVPHLEEFEGEGVYYAATLFEAQLCLRAPVVVVGGGNSAGQASIFLARHAGRVRLLVRSGDLAKDMSRYLIDEIQRNPGIQVLLNTEIEELVGDRELRGVITRNNRTGERREIEAMAIFVFIGAEPHTRWLRGEIALDDKGFVLTGPDALKAAGEKEPWHETGRPYPLETNLMGVFAVGDVRGGSIKRVASAVGEGSMAIRLIHEHLQTAGQPPT